MKFAKTKVLLALAIALISACSAAPKKESSATSGSVPKPLTVDERIAAAAELASKAINELYVIERSSQKVTKPQTNQAPSGLGSVVNAKWTGPVDQFLARVTELSSGYKFVVRGKEPAIPVIVTVDSKNVTIFELIKNAGVQSGVRANVIIDTSGQEKLVVLEYAS